MRYLIVRSFNEKELRKALRKRYPTPGWPSWRNAKIAERTLIRAMLLASATSDVFGEPIPDIILTKIFLVEFYAATEFLFLVPPIAKNNPFKSSREADEEAATGLVGLMVDLGLLEEVDESLVPTVQFVDRLLKS